MQFMQAFYDEGSVVSDLNTTFIALIPKIKNLVSLKDYRSISLLGSFYKVLAKVLANRLKDVKWDSVPLSKAFPRIFALATNKFGCINEFDSWSNSIWVWKINLRRPLFDWELEQWKCFKLMLDSIQLRFNFPDTLSWSYATNGIFSVSSFRTCLEVNTNAGDLNCDFLWKGLCPPKVKVFVWQLLKGRVLVRKVLLKFGMATQMVKYWISTVRCWFRIYRS
ncbi:hypothetical protein QYF36_024580 [Acer negundo]|nr:hypothetical protein QYF36_024580 [Acer negundo]